MVEKLSQVGEPPEISQIQNPTLMADYKPVTQPLPLEPDNPHLQPNSLWQKGARAFFKDQRASRVGDVVTVDIKFEDKGKIDGKFETGRTTTHSSQLANLYGYEKYVKKIFPRGVKNSSLVDVGSSSSVIAEGKRDMSQKTNLKIAATIIQVLPNGNMVIQGRREVRISNDVRTIELKGIIRRQDIAAGNRIPYARIAEARLSDVSKGQIADLNQTPWGQQLLNMIQPF